MKKALIVGNWKMHNTVHQSSLLVNRLTDLVKTHSNVEVVLCPSMLALQSISLQVNHRQFKLGAQNCYWRDEGAFTGEVSATMLQGIAQYVIIGHSERRHIFHERDRDFRSKVQAVIRNHMKPILCVGETVRERADGETREVIHDQLIGGLANVTSEEIKDIAIAYEPVWAIGTGQNAEPRDVEQVASIIFRQVRSLYGAEAAKNLRILYGGSVNEHNASQYLGLKNIHGLLVGGASLDAHAFAAIVGQAHVAQKQATEDKA